MWDGLWKRVRAGIYVLVQSPWLRLVPQRWHVRQSATVSWFRVSAIRNVSARTGRVLGELWWFEWYKIEFSSWFVKTKNDYWRIIKAQFMRLKWSFKNYFHSSIVNIWYWWKWSFGSRSQCHSWRKRFGSSKFAVVEIRQLCDSRRKKNWKNQ